MRTAQSHIKWERSMAADIIYMAINDYATRTKDVRVFFNSKWGSELCDYLDLNANEILAGLESGKIQIKRYPNGKPMEA